MLYIDRDEWARVIALYNLGAIGWTTIVVWMALNPAAAPNLPELDDLNYWVDSPGLELIEGPGS